MPNDFERAADCLEWVFYLPGLEDVVPQRVCAREVAKALDNVIRATFAQVGNPLEVKLAWQMVLDLMGPVLFGHFVRMRAWKDFTPPVPKLLDTPCRHTRPLPSGKFSLGEFLFPTHHHIYMSSRDTTKYRGTTRSV